MKAGIYQNFDAALYHADPCETQSLNQSTAKLLITKHPRSAYERHPRLGGNGMVPKKNMDRGNIVHAWLMNQEAGIEVIDAKDYRTNAAKEQRDSAQKRGKYVILKNEHDELRDALPLIRANLLDAGVTLAGPCEQTFVWLSDGTLCRTRIDNTSDDLCEVFDLKCSNDANPQSLPRHIHDMCYDLQAAAHLDAIETLRPELAGRIKFADVFIEMESPYFVVRAEHSESMLEVGRSKWRRAKGIWQQCLDSGKWPGYQNRITVHATNWAISREFGEQA
jgi:hypothetical protein